MQLLQQEVLARLLGPGFKIAEAQIFGNGGNGLAVAPGFLADIQLQQFNAEAVDAVDEVQQLAVGDFRQAAVHQRAVAQQQRLQQFIFALDGLAVVGVCAAQLFRQPVPGGFQALAGFA